MLPQNVREVRTRHHSPGFGPADGSLTVLTPDLEEYSPSAKGLPEAVAETEKQMLIEALEESNWNMTRAAEALGITFRSMRYNVKKYGLSREEGLSAGARR